MRVLPLAAAVAALFICAGPAHAGDPTMPLSDVRPGMQCTGYSVIRGTEISTFDVEVLDVAAGDATGNEARILVRASGPAVDGTGLGPGFSGSPIYCPDGAGVQRVIGAISESIGEFGGLVVLATPIADIIGTPVDVPRRGAATARLSPRMRAALAAAKPMRTPLTVSGLSTPLANALTAAGAKVGRPVIAVPPGPLGTFAPQVLRPGSAVAVGYATGDVRASAIGTVAYVDGDRVWVFAHQLEGVGPRALLLQDAYVYRIINNPLQIGSVASTYKFASSGHDLGTVSSDGVHAVAGRTGPLPHTVPVEVLARDEDARRDVALNARAADEAAVDLPSGGSWTSFIAPLAVAQAINKALGSTPGRLTGEMCVRIGIAELRRPLRFCNRYVSTSVGQNDDGSISNAVLSGAVGDLGGALATIDAYTGKPPQVTGVKVFVKVRRGADQAFIRSISVPRKVKPGQRVRVRVRLQRVRGGELRRTYTLRIPRDARPGRQRLRLVGQDADQGENAFTTIILTDDEDDNEGGDPGPKSLRELASRVRSTGRYDGVSVRVGRARGRAFRDAGFRISGQADATVRVVRR
jgi:hypothetical protein